MRCTRRWPRSTSRRTSRRRRSTPRSVFLEKEPDNPRALRIVYEANRKLGNQGEADKALKALQSQKGADVATLLYNEGAEALKLGDLDSAQKRFEEALEAKPDLHQATEALMVVYGRKNDWANAVAQAEKVLANDPQNLRALRIRHDGYTRLGDKAKEKEAFDALAKADPDALAGALLDSGINKFNANDTAGAIADLDQVVQIDSRPRHRALLPRPLLHQHFEAGPGEEAPDALPRARPRRSQRAGRARDAQVPQVIG